MAHGGVTWHSQRSTEPEVSVTAHGAGQGVFISPESVPARAATSLRVVAITVDITAGDDASMRVFAISSQMP
eukprot:6205438-Pleurochrysis_carterae.AAC.2